MSTTTVTSVVRKKAEDWMQANPAALEYFEKLALEKAKRRQRFGINQLREVFRWHFDGAVTSEQFKFCNSYSPYLARALIAKHPSLGQYMRCKATKDEMEMFSGTSSGSTSQRITDLYTATLAPPAPVIQLRMTEAEIVAAATAKTAVVLCTKDKTFLFTERRVGVPTITHASGDRRIISMEHQPLWLSATGTSLFVVENDESEVWVERIVPSEDDE